MTAIFGREPELSRIKALLASSVSGRIARAIRIVGSSGVGKTALIEAALESAPAAWLKALVSSHRIQASLPYFAARRLVRMLLNQLGEDAARYSLGLDSDREPSMFEEAFFRTLEGLSLDHPLLLAFDDAQWADDESRALVQRCIIALGDRAIVLISCDRSEDSGTVTFDLRDEAIALNELDERAATGVVKNIYPAANDEVVLAIVDRAGGRPVDIVALSEGARDQEALTASDVDASLRRTIARDLTLVDAGLREFLQICSLIADPIDFPLLRALWPEERLLPLIAAASDRFVEQGDDGLHFVHDAVKQSVRETIAIAIPVHRRIIAAIKSLPAMRFEDYERIAEHAAACGDRELERQTLMTLGDEAMKASMHSLAASAWERAVAIAPPAESDALAFYTRMAMMYNILSREADSIRVCKAGLEFARNSGIAGGTSTLISSLAFAQWNSGDLSSARIELARHLEAASIADRAPLLSAQAYLLASSGDNDGAQRAIDEVLALGSDAPALAKLRVHVVRAVISSRRGNVAEAALAAEAAEHESTSLPPLARIPALVASVHHRFMHGGPRKVEDILERRSGEHGAEVLDILQIVSHIARGEFEDARTTGSEALVRQRGVSARRTILGLRFTAVAFDAAPLNDAEWNSLLAEIAAFQTGDESAPLMLIVMPWLVHASNANAKRAKALLARILDRFSHDVDPLMFFHPVLLSKAAKILGDDVALERLAAPGGIHMNAEPWVQAHVLLARGAAANALGRAEARDLLDDAHEGFALLGAPFFASMAAQLAKNESPAATKRDDGRFGTTTRREREIAALVAEGLTNREIAAKLVLSERTIEGHVANLFNKLDVSSRTQVAAWYLRATSSVASR